MGKEVDSGIYEVVDRDGYPVADVEFAFLQDENFSVPVSHLKLAEVKGSVIPGVSTPSAALTRKYLNHVNIFPVTIKFLNYPVEDVLNTCYTVCGGTTAANLAAMVHGRLELEPLADVFFTLNGKAVHPNTMMSTLCEMNNLSHTFLELECTYEEGPALVPEDQANNEQEGGAVDDPVAVPFAE